MNPPERPLTTKEAAEYLQLVEGTIRNLAYKGTLRVAGKAGNRLRFWRRDLDRYLRESGHPKGASHATET